MRIKFHEVELGVKETASSKNFYHSVLGLKLAVDQDQLKVFDTGVRQLDLNFSNHLPEGVVLLSFLCDNLDEMMKKLTESDITFDGPVVSHLGLQTVSFNDPAGYRVKINAATDQSPDWLRSSFDIS